MLEQMWVLFANRGLLLDKTQFILDITSNIRIYSNLLLNLFFNFWFFEIFFREIIFFVLRITSGPVELMTVFSISVEVTFGFVAALCEYPSKHFHLVEGYPLRFYKCFFSELSFFFNSLFRKRRQTFQDFAVNPNF